ncbi:MAG TPA: hypothetical protein DCS67_05555, partial [Clostridiales bacterium UBA8960]|nr:hypothetical protein [Clostridiales bacterium UBA8960]
LRDIIEIDKTTAMEVETIEKDITQRETQLKKIISDIEINSEALKMTQSKRLLDRIQSETDAQIEKIQSDCDAQLSSMELLFEEKKAQMIRRALEKLSVGRWDNSCTK